MNKEDNSLKINKKALKKVVSNEFLKENNKYKEDRRGTTLAVMLVLIAVMLMFVFAKQRGIM